MLEHECYGEVKKMLKGRRIRNCGGRHSRAFTQEGFNAGTFPLEIAPDDLSGGSVSNELGSSSHAHWNFAVEQF
jgi:hypothetical protein